MNTLNRVLLLNSLSSGVTGLGLILFASTVATLFGVSTGTAFTEVGIFLVVFAIVVFMESRSNPHRVGRLRLIIVADVTWVVVSLAIVFLQLFNLTTIGYATIGAVALWVAAMAYLQLMGFKQLVAQS